MAEWTQEAPASDVAAPSTVRPFAFRPNYIRKTRIKMLILMYIMLSGIKMQSLTDFGAPGILMTMETWENNPPGSTHRYTTSASFCCLFSNSGGMSVSLYAGCPPKSCEKTKKGACGVWRSDNESKVFVSNPDRNQKTLKTSRRCLNIKHFLKFVRCDLSVYCSSVSLRQTLTADLLSVNPLWCGGFCVRQQTQHAIFQSPDHHVSRPKLFRTFVDETEAAAED